MGDLTEHFSWREFACKKGTCPHCNGSSPVDLRLVNGLEILRQLVSERLQHDSPLRISSGFRCKAHNAEVAGASGDSYHTRGWAADVLLPGRLAVSTLFRDPLLEFVTLALAVPQFNKGGMGAYRSPARIHVDVRLGGAARFGDAKELFDS